MAAVLLLGMAPEMAFAKNASGAAAFDDLKWEKILEKSVKTKSGVVQSICATDDYIICMENSGDNCADNDIVYAYYKNPWDEEGNPVEQYSLAFINDSWDWEHCNGMCYNPATDEIYVAPYTSNNPENRGCILVMDPHTLDYVRSIRVADYYNILGIGYYPEKGRYIIQANAEGDYGIKILDGNFNKLADTDGKVLLAESILGLGSNSQDLCVCGDYIMNFPLTFDWEGMGSYMNVYEIDDGGDYAPDDYPIQFKLLKQLEMDLETAGTKKVEPESICEVEDGVFVVTVNIMSKKGKRSYAWYKTELGGYRYSIRTECSNGMISDSHEVLKGGSYTVQYKPEPGFTLQSVVVDGVELDPREYPASYTFADVYEDHRIAVSYREKETAPAAGDQGSDGKGPTFEKTQKNRLSWEFLIIAGALLLAVLIGIGRYIQILHVERRKKYLRKKIRREKERLAREELNRVGESFAEEEEDLDFLLQEISDLEREFSTVEKTAANTEENNRKKEDHAHKV